MDQRAEGGAQSGVSTDFTILKNDPADRERSLRRTVAFLQSLPLDKAFKVKVEDLKPRRSENQNRYLFGVVYPEIAKHLDGFDKDDIHEFCLGEWAGWEVVEAFGKKRQRPIRRSSALTKHEFADFIAHIQRKMAERGIVIPDPQLSEEAA